MVAEDTAYILGIGAVRDDINDLVPASTTPTDKGVEIAVLEGLVISMVCRLGVAIEEASALGSDA